MPVAFAVEEDFEMPLLAGRVFAGPQILRFGRLQNAFEPTASLSTVSGTLAHSGWRISSTSAVTISLIGLKAKRASA